MFVLALFWVRGVRLPRMVGSLFSASAVSLGVVTAISLMFTEVIGVGDFTYSVMVREPVTVTTFIPSSVSGLSGGSCAQTALLPRATAAAEIADTPGVHRSAMCSPF